MNLLSAEVIGRYDSPGDCSSLLYAPIDGDLTFRRTRVYEIGYTGDREDAEAFVRRTLVDAVSEEVQFDTNSVLEDYRFFIDYGMKAGALDLEKEAIMNFFKGSRRAAERHFSIESLKIMQRIYVFGEGAEAKPFVRDIVNTAIHTWTVTDARNCA